jgi:hypothetical protein
MELLHDYQGIRHRFKDDDLDPRLLERGQAIIIEILKLQNLIDISLLRYDLSFYSGGMGIIDNLFIKLSCNSTTASEIISSLKLVDVANDNLDLELRDYLIWRTTDDEESEDSVDVYTLVENNKISQLVNEEKADFQDIASSNSFICFREDTGPNYGTIIYYLNGNLNYISYDYG